MPSIAQKGSRVKPLAGWIATYELVWLALIAPFLLFPNRWTPLAALLLPLIWISRRLSTGRFTVPTPMDGAIALLVVTAVIGFYVSADPTMSRAKLWGIVLQAALFYAMVNGLRSEKGIRRMAGFLVLLTAGVAAFSLVGTDWDTVRLVDLHQVYDRFPRLIQGLPGSGVPRASDLFSPREVGATMAMLLPISVALLFFGEDRLLRALSVLALVAGGVIFLLAQSLQALFGLATALLLVAVWRSRWFLLSVPLGLLTLAGGLLAYGPERAARALLSVDHPIGIGVVLRLDIWSRALAMIRDMPYTGVGLNTFPLVQTNFYPGVLLGPEPHAHNLFLQTAVDLGLPGLLALVWLLAAFSVVVIRAYRATLDRDLRVLLVGLAAGVLAYVVHGFVDTVTLGAKPIAGLFAMLGVAAAIWRQGAEGKGRGEGDPAPVPSAPTSARLTALRWPVLITAFALLFLLMSALLAPAVPPRNLGAIRAQKVLVEARTTGAVQDQLLRSALASLQRALARDPDNVYLHERLGSLYAWQGDYRAAMAAFEDRVALDGQDPVGRYAPFEALRRQIQGETAHDPWDDVLWIYGNWMQRFPERAEPYVQVALVWEKHKGDATRARAVIESGLENGAEPAGLLRYYLSGAAGYAIIAHDRAVARW
jgi:putative inorganic carbon (HCO3(-)) transporter